jgi:hypothetical protein
LWLDAVDSFTVTGTSPVTAWADKSGNANNTTSYMGSPTLNTNAINGRRAISFNGSSGFFGNISNSSNTLSVFFVGTHASTSFGRGVSLGTSAQSDWNVVGNINAISGNNNGVQVVTYRNSSPIMVYTPLSSTTPFIYNFVINGSTFNGFVNGTLISSTASSGNFGYSRYGIGTQIGPVGTQQENWTGLIGEVIIFHTALTTFENQQVQGYLAWKWGLYTNLPTAHPFRPNPVFTRPFQPIDIAGCALWLDAADRNTMTFSLGNNISTWNDKSSSGLIGTAFNIPNQTPNSINGLPAVVFSSGTQYIDYGNNLNLGTNGVYVFTVAKYDNTSDGTIVGKSSARGLAGRWSLLRIYGSTDMLADAAGSGVQSGYTDNSTLTQLISGYWDRSNVVMRQNGTQRNSVGLSSSTNLSNSDSLFVGAYQSSSGGGPPTGGLYFIGKIGEIIVYIPPNPLTVNQIQQVESYLAWKWGLQSILPTTVTNPTRIPNLSLWLDATDPNGNGTLPSNNDVITSWKDKSGSSNHLSGLNSPRWLSSPPRMSMTGTAYFTGSGPTSYNMTAFFVYIDANSSCAPTYTANDPVNTDITGIFANCIGTTYIQASYGWSTQPSTIPKNVVNLLVLQYNSAFNSNNVKVYLNGALNMTTSSAPFTRTSFTLGRRRTEYMQGSYYEALFYNSFLTDNQRKQVENYLGMKWGISSSSLSTQPYFALQAPLTTPIFTPTSLNGIALWLDAADRNTLFSDSAGATLVGTSGNIGMWKDKSQSSNNYIQTTSGDRPSFLNNTVMCSMSGQSLTSSTASNVSGIDAFIVGKPLASTATWRTLFRGSVTDHPILIESGTTRLGYYVNSAGFFPFGNLVLDGSTTTIIYLNIPTNRVPSCALNGTLALSTNTGTLDSAATFTSIGNNFGGGQPWGDINEIIFMSNVTTSQRQQVEGYLAWKWGLQNNLPTTHPYRKFRS